MICKRKGCRGRVETEKKVQIQRDNKAVVFGHPCSSSICGLLHTKNGGHFPKPGSKKKVAFWKEGNIAWQKL